MESSLKERIEYARGARHMFPDRFSHAYTRERIGTTLANFYENDAFSKQVSERKSSYKTRSERLGARWRSLISRLRTTPLDTDYDDKVDKVTSALNRVGESPVEKANYTIAGNRHEQLLFDIAGIVLGSAGGYALSKVMWDVGDIGPSWVPFTLPLLGFGVGRFLHAKLFEKRLEYLVDAAERTDAYLRAHPI